MNFIKRLFGGSKTQNQPTVVQPERERVVVSATPPSKKSGSPVLEQAEVAATSESAQENRRREMFMEFEKVQIDAMVEATLHGRGDTIDYACDKAAKHAMRLYGLSLDELRALIKEGSQKWSSMKNL
jgi:hypothetical protein